jgi:uncharacterized protein YndB with AHSA1/START domain
VETTSERLSVTREVVIDASPETVWEFLVDPDKITRWKGTGISFVAEVGSPYRIDVVPGAAAVGEIVELDPPRRLVYTWGWEGHPTVPPGSTTVAYELFPEGTGTRLRLTHSDLPSADEVDSHTHGWEHYLQRLAVAAAGGEPGSDPFVTERSA